MAQPHKGAREQILAPVAELVVDHLGRMKLEYGSSSVSQIAADLLALAVNQPGAVRELDQQVLSVREPIVSDTKAHNGSRTYIKVRVPEIVAVCLRKLAAEHNTNPSQACADLLAIAVGHPELVRELHEEVMPLAM